MAMAPIKIKTSLPNPSKLETNNLYIDMTRIIQPCSHTARDREGDVGEREPLRRSAVPGGDAKEAAIFINRWDGKACKY